MNRRLMIVMTQHWTPEQLLAVYDFSRELNEAIWQQHEDELLELMYERDQKSGHEPISCQRQDNLELPFDDPIPF